MDGKHSEIAFYSPSGTPGDVRCDVCNNVTDNGEGYPKSKMFFCETPWNPVYIVISFNDDVEQEELEYLYGKIQAAGIANIDPEKEAKEDLEKGGSIKHTQFEMKYVGGLGTAVQFAREVFNDFNLPGNLDRLEIFIRDYPSEIMKAWLDKKEAKQKNECEPKV